jgi:hypothetical protein
MPAWAAASAVSDDWLLRAGTMLSVTTRSIVAVPTMIKNVMSRT